MQRSSSSCAKYIVEVNNDHIHTTNRSSPPLFALSIGLEGQMLEHDHLLLLDVCSTIFELLAAKIRHVGQFGEWDAAE
jgi:hypothetical protein